MAQYGFRLFTVERKNGGGNTSQVFECPDWGDFTAYLNHAYLKQVGVKHHESPSDSFDDDGNPSELDPNSRIIRMDWVEQRSSRVFFAFSSGKNDGFRDAMTIANGAPDVPMTHLAPRRQYRGVYVLPPNQKVGVLALECISRSCPTAVLKRWTNVWGKSLVEDDDTHKFSRCDYEQMTDTREVNRLLSSGEPKQLVLTEHASNGDGLGASVEYRLEAPLRQKGGAMAMVRGWVRSPRTVEEGIAEARALFGGAIDEVDFDDCYVSLRLEGQTKHVRPDSYSDLYTYDNGDSQRLTRQYYAAVNEKLAALGLARAMELDLSAWPTALPELGETT